MDVSNEFTAEFFNSESPSSCSEKIQRLIQCMLMLETLNLRSDQISQGDAIHSRWLTSLNSGTHACWRLKIKADVSWSKSDVYLSIYLSTYLWHPTHWSLLMISYLQLQGASRVQNCIAQVLLLPRGMCVSVQGLASKLGWRLDTTHLIQFCKSCRFP